MDVDPRKTAVVLIEYQNDFTSDGGALHDAVKGVMEETGMLENTERMVERARAAGATIVHAPISFAPGLRRAGRPGQGVRDPQGRGRLERLLSRAPGAWRSATGWRRGGDIVVEGKRGLDTFATTNLDFVLRSRDSTTVVLGGFLTNCCVESTMRTAYERGYDVITLTDCTAATSADEQRRATEHGLSDVLAADDERPRWSTRWRARRRSATPAAGTEPAPPRQSIARRRNPRTPIAVNSASEKVSATRQIHGRMCGTDGVSAPRMPSLT